MKIRVGILGATGAIGEEYIRLLQGHPWFDITFLAASEKRVGELSDSGITYSSLKDITTAKRSCDFIFSALPNELAKEFDSLYLENGLSMVSHASCHRMKKDVPLIIPEVNPEHLTLIKNKKSFLVAKPNCALISFVLPLAPLRHFGIEKILVTTMQSLSGAGIKSIKEDERNLQPFIENEEEKIESEPIKILGAPIAISAQCNRVPTMFGHYACTSVLFRKKPSKEEMIQLWKDFEGLSLPSSQKQPLQYVEDAGPELKKDLKEMAVTIGRLRPCPIFDYRFVALSHNTVRGGAGGGILIAELLHEKKMI